MNPTTTPFGSQDVPSIKHDLAATIGSQLASHVDLKDISLFTPIGNNDNDNDNNTENAPSQISFNKRDKIDHVPSTLQTRDTCKTKGQDSPISMHNKVNTVDTYSDDVDECSSSERNLNNETGTKNN